MIREPTNPEDWKSTIREETRSKLAAAQIPLRAVPDRKEVETSQRAVDLLDLVERWSEAFAELISEHVPTSVHRVANHLSVQAEQDTGAWWATYHVWLYR